MLLHAGCSPRALHLDDVSPPWRASDHHLHAITVKNGLACLRRNNSRILRRLRGILQLSRLTELRQDTVHFILQLLRPSLRSYHGRRARWQRCHRPGCARPLHQ